MYIASPIYSIDIHLIKMIRQKDLIIAYVIQVRLAYPALLYVDVLFLVVPLHLYHWPIGVRRVASLGDDFVELADDI